MWTEAFYPDRAQPDAVYLAEKRRGIPVRLHGRGNLRLREKEKTPEGVFFVCLILPRRGWNFLLRIFGQNFLLERGW